MNEKEIKQPSYIRKPDFIVGYAASVKREFECLECKAVVTTTIDKETFECFEGFLNLSKKEHDFLKLFYNIGITNKSHEGGFSVFQKTPCKKCNTAYYIYLGISEPTNSLFHIQIQGILKTDQL